MVVQLLEQQKDMVIGKKIVDIKADSKSVHIETEDGHTILIKLEKRASLRHTGYVVFEAVLNHQVGVPGKET